MEDKWAQKLLYLQINYNNIVYTTCAFCQLDPPERLLAKIFESIEQWQNQDA